MRGHSIKSNSVYNAFYKTIYKTLIKNIPEMPTQSQAYAVFLSKRIKEHPHTQELYYKVNNILNIIEDIILFASQHYVKKVKYRLDNQKPKFNYNRVCQELLIVSEIDNYSKFIDLNMNLMKQLNAESWYSLLINKAKSGVNYQDKNSFSITSGMAGLGAQVFVTGMDSTNKAAPERNEKKESEKSTSPKTLSTDNATNSLSPEFEYKLDEYLSYIIFWAFKVIVCGISISSKLYADSPAGTKKECETALLDKAVVSKLDYISEYVKNHFLNQLLNDKKTTVGKIFLEFIPILYILMLNTLNYQNNYVNVPYIIDGNEFIDSVKKHINIIMALRYNINQIMREWQLECDVVKLPPALNTINIVDAGAIYRLILKYNAQKDSDELMLAVPKVKCVLLELFVLLMFKVKKIISKYNELKKIYPEISDDMPVQEINNILGMDFTEKVREAASYSLKYSDYCKVSNIKFKFIEQ